MEFEETLKVEYYFSHGVRGKHYEVYRKGHNIVLLDPNVASGFKDSESVNRVLRLFLQLAKEQVPIA